MDRPPATLTVDYYRQLMMEPVLVQQKAAKSTRSFAVLLTKARDNVLRRETLFEKDTSNSAAALLLLKTLPDLPGLPFGFRRKFSGS